MVGITDRGDWPARLGRATLGAGKRALGETRGDLSADVTMSFGISSAPHAYAFAAAGSQHRAAAGSPRAAPAATRAELDPAVVNHVERARAGGGTDSEPEGEAASGQVDEPPHAEEVRQLKARDAEVRAHERAHAAAAGALAGATSYQYERGPDGRSYAVSGEVQISMPVDSGDPEATIRTMERVKRAALAPQSPSDADRAVAAHAEAQITAARRESSTADAQDPPEASSAPANAPSADATHTAFSGYERRNAGAATYQRPEPVPTPGHVLDVVS
jgi:hypothetical protein